MTNNPVPIPVGYDLELDLDLGLRKQYFTLRFGWILTEYSVDKPRNVLGCETLYRIRVSLKLYDVTVSDVNFFPEYIRHGREEYQGQSLVKSNLSSGFY